VYDGHIVIIFDECHRSQFGDMHTAITKAFKRYNLFGFTGTPIFAENSSTGGNPRLRTTEQAFGEKLHTYTIVDAITDKNVLPFRIDYVNTIKLPKGIADKKVSAIDTERALLAPERITQVVRYIREHFDQKTRRSGHYKHRVLTNIGDVVVGREAGTRRRRESRRLQRVQLAAGDGVDRRREAVLRRVQGPTGDVPVAQRLRVGLIFSFAPTRPRTTACCPRRGSRPKAWTRARGTSWTPRSWTTTPCSGPATTPRPTSSRTTTRTCRCG
jgi:type I restriction enzyme R subunit